MSAARPRTAGNDDYQDGERDREPDQGVGAGEVDERIAGRQAADGPEPGQPEFVAGLHA